MYPVEVYRTSAGSSPPMNSLLLLLCLTVFTAVSATTVDTTFECINKCTSERTGPEVVRELCKNFKKYKPDPQVGSDCRWVFSVPS
jgi:hypothetical protein